jgi:predicted negative regulator of RcsB-dependent stress response
LISEKRLAKGDPSNAGWRRDLSVSFNKIGEVQAAQGDLAAALTSYQASLAIRERLSAADPGNAGWQRDLSVSHERIGEVQAAQGDLAAALTSYQASLISDSGWPRRTRAMPSGSAICPCRTTGSATCSEHRAT